MLQIIYISRYIRHNLFFNFFFLFMKIETYSIVFKPHSTLKIYILAHVVTPINRLAIFALYNNGILLGGSWREVLDEAICSSLT